LRTANTPPPMALHEINIQTNTIDVAFNADASMIAVLHMQGLSIFEWKNITAAGPGPQLTGRVTFDKNESTHAVYLQVTLTENNEILVLQRLDSKCLIKRYGFNEDTGRVDEMSFIESPSTGVLNLSSFYQGGVAHSFVQGKSGDLSRIPSGDHSLSHCSFPAFLPWAEVVPHGEDYIAFGLSSSGHLYANSRLLVKNCTSFLVTPAHLIFTTTTHLLKFVHITNSNGM